ncbi:MAG TPA: squalene/phytoene synthase family protein, partial [Phycisphaerales bacterium]|nr:squalene/phytoene synthase family protein [Phycisphaerales bacterium]
MTAHTIDQLALYGPDRCEAMSVQDARRWCAQLAKNHYENFSVLTSVVPGDLRGDFAVVYAFCRWSDDLGDEVGDRARATDLLAWWRQELRMCFEGNPRHPVFVALQPTITQHALEMQPFADLISAFEMDQRVTRYQTWDELIGYCKLSANPVGRLVLGLFDELKGADASRKLKASDQICTALQLTNHIQDIKRDFLERDRIYVPREMINIDDFESRLRASAKQGFGIDQNFLGETRVVIRECVERTWKMFEDGGRLLD